MSKPKILMVGDAGVQSGFAACTHHLCDHLHATGWDVTVLAMGYYGDPDIQAQYPYKLYPCRSPFDNAFDYFGVDRLPSMVADHKPDVVVFLNDPWNIRAYLNSLKRAGLEDKVLKVGWLAVDAENHVYLEAKEAVNKGDKVEFTSTLNRLDHIITWTQFGKRELQKGGYNKGCSVVSLGVDTSVFKPGDKVAARERRWGAMGLPMDATIIGVVGRNQIRKGLDIAIRVFKKYLDSTGDDNTWLYLHVAPTGEDAFDLQQVSNYYGVQHRIAVRVTEVNKGDHLQGMVDMYNMLDVYLSTSWAEGWGLPALEAMACGIPCVLPDHSAFGEWAKPAAAMVPCNRDVMTAPRSSMFTIGKLVDEDECASILSHVVKNTEYHADGGLTLADLYTWQSMAKMMAMILNTSMLLKVT